MLWGRGEGGGTTEPRYYDATCLQKQRGGRVSGFQRSRWANRLGGRGDF